MEKKVRVFFFRVNRLVPQLPIMELPTLHCRQCVQVNKKMHKSNHDLPPVHTRRISSMVIAVPDLEDDGFDVEESVPVIFRVGMSGCTPHVIRVMCLNSFLSSAIYRHAHVC